MADALEREGIRLLPSTALLQDQLATAGRHDPPAARRGTSARTSSTGAQVARALAGLDLGQTVVVKDRAAVALEAMEGTDEVIRRAGRIAGPGATVVKVAKPRQDMRFDVPVVGPGTLEAMREAGAARARGGGRRRRSCSTSDAFLAAGGRGRASRSGASRREDAARDRRASPSSAWARSGQHHARVYAGAARAPRWSASTTSSAERAREVAAPPRLPGASSTSRDLLAGADAVSVAVPTVDHHRWRAPLLEAGKDVLVEKPMTTTLAEADDLIRAGRRAAGASSRSATSSGSTRPWTSCAGHATAARGSSRSTGWAPFSPRSLDIDVVLDLMIHDLDIVLSLDGSEPVQVDAVGVPVLTPRVDIANARLRFASGPDRQPDRQPGLGREGPQVPGLRTPDLHLGRLRGPGGPGLPADGGPTAGPRSRSSASAAPDEEPLRRQLEAFVRAVRDRSRARRLRGGRPRRAGPGP